MAATGRERRDLPLRLERWLERWLERTAFAEQLGSYSSAGFLRALESHAGIARQHGLQKSKSVPRFKRGTLCL